MAAAEEVTAVASTEEDLRKLPKKELLKLLTASEANREQLLRSLSRKRKIKELEKSLTKVGKPDTSHEQKDEEAPAGERPKVTTLGSTAPHRLTAPPRRSGSTLPNFCLSGYLRMGSLPLLQPPQLWV
jgi:hypothetical protein